VSAEKLTQIIRKGNAQELVTQAEALGTRFGKKKERSSESVVSTNQIRAIFSTVRQIEMNWPLVNARPEQEQKAERDLLLLKPKMVYRASRDASSEFRDFSALMGSAIDLVLEPDASAPPEEQKSTRDRFGYFVDFFEAIMAYHKAESENKQTDNAQKQGGRR
jgi:CRISPR-associated protein Csm2